MKKITVFFFFAFLHNVLFGLNVHTILTKNNDEIDEKLRGDIVKMTFLILDHFKNGDTKELEKRFSKEMLSSSSNLSQMLPQIKPLLVERNLTVVDEYLSKIDKVGWGKTFSIFPEVNGERSLNVVKAHIPTQFAYFVFLKSESEQRKGLGALIYFQYIKRADNWKLHAFHVGDYTLDGLNAPDLMEKCTSKEKALIVAGFYCIAAQKILKPAPFLQYPKEKEYIETLTKVFQEINSKFNFPISLKNGAEASLFQIDLKITGQEGMFPLLKYKTDTKTTDGNAIKEEAGKLFVEIEKLFPNLAVSFEYTILQAYNEFPNDPQKTYQIFNTIFKEGKRI